MTENQPNQKREWRTPEIIEVGSIVDVTAGDGGNVRDPGSDPMTYDRNAHGPLGEVDLEG
jgi:hypothetical protein